MSTIDLTGVSFAITGKDSVVSRADLINQIKAANGTICAAVQPWTTFLLTGRNSRSEPTKKLKDADKYGVTQIDIGDCVEWMRNPGDMSLAAAARATAAINRARSAPAPGKKPKASAAKIKKLFKTVAKIENSGFGLIDF